MNQQTAQIAVMGATGMVGKEVLEVLHTKGFNGKTIRIFASERSAGKTQQTPFGEKTIEHADNINYSDFDIAFFAIGGSWPKENAPRAMNAGCTVIDNSSAFRYDDSVPLIIPEINPEDLGNSKLIANPNCTTAIAAIPLWHIHQHYGIVRAIFSTYQATSGAGNEGMSELQKQTQNYLEGKEITHSAFVHPIPFNLIPHIDAFQENGYTREEMKVVWEMRKIFHEPELPISCTAVRIPTMRAHSESITLETKKPVDVENIRKLLSSQEGIEVRDDIQNNIYPMPLTATHKYNVEVGRIRANTVFGEHGIDLFVSGDQVLRGAALNAVLIAELVIAKRG